MLKNKFVSFYTMVLFRQLCVLLKAEDIYKTLAQILLEENNLKFASLMVEHLNMILLTSSELYELRNNMKALKLDVRFKTIHTSYKYFNIYCRKTESYFFNYMKLGAIIQ